jgi:serine/threonine protein kinase
MDEDRGRQLARIFNEAFDLDEPERAAYLEVACIDPALKAEVESMLRTGTRPSPLDGGILQFAVSALGVAPDPDPPDAFDRYRLVKRLGRGGMGQVWLAAHTLENGSVRNEAVKFIRGTMTEDGRRRLVDEIARLLKLRCPYIVPLYADGVLEDGRPFFSMAYVETGLPVTAFCESAKLSVHERLSLFRKICEAVQYAHDNGIIHRDLKPENILVDAYGVPQLLDFGIATEAMGGSDSEVGLQPMTPAYSAPELWNGQPATAASDVWALGVILYQMLTGVYPYARQAEGRRDVAAAICAGAANPPSAFRGQAGFDDQREDWRDLDVLCRYAMHLDQEMRYQTVEQLAADIGRYLSARPLEKGATRMYRARKFASRNRWPVRIALAAVAVVVLMAFVLVAFYVVLVFHAGNSQFYQDRYDASERLYQAICPILHRNEVKSLFVADCLINLGHIKTNKGDYGAAEGYFREAVLASRDVWFGDSETATAVAESYLAQAFMYEGYEGNKGKFVESAELLQRAIPVLRHSYPNGNVELAIALGTAGSVAEGAGRSEEARDDFLKAAEMERRLRPSQPFLGVDLANLGGLYLDARQYQQAASYLTEALGIFEKAGQARQFAAGVAHIRLGRCRLLQGLLAEAEKQTREGYEIVKGLAPSNNTFLNVARGDLAAANDELGRPDKAKKFRAELPASQ